MCFLIKVMQNIEQIMSTISKQMNTEIACSEMNVNHSLFCKLTGIAIGTYAQARTNLVKEDKSLERCVHCPGVCA
jgi:hypothetical protein